MSFGIIKLGGTGSGAVDSVNGYTGVVVLTTTDIAEGTNLYYTSARFDSDFSGKTTTDLAEGINLYYTSARFDSDFSGKTTTDLAEGTNLYYTQARFDSAFAAKSTSDLSEGTNLYFTDERAQDAVGANVVAPLLYNDPTGEILILQSSGSMDGYLSSADWTMFYNRGKLVPQTSIASPFSMSTNSVITPSSDFRQYWFINSGGGALVLVSNPQISAGSFVGQEIILQGTDDSNYMIFNSANGLSLNGDCYLKNKSTLHLVWDGLVWNEVSRNDI